MAHHTEWLIQAEVARLFGAWLPADCFWTAIDAAGTSPTTGKMRRLRGCRPGTPDLWIVHRGRLIGIELKNPTACGRCSPAQLKVRAELLAAGADWWQANSASSAMAALALSGVQFRMIAHSNGEIECWRQPELEPWEVPRRDPAEPQPSAPLLKAQLRERQRRWRERKRARKAAQALAANRTADVPAEPPRPQPISSLPPPPIPGPILPTSERAWRAGSRRRRSKPA